MTSTFVIFEPGIPECFKRDITDASDWCLLRDWDDFTDQQENEFSRWLNALPLGVIHNFPVNCKEFTIVKVTHEDSSC